jgi:small subunit ribosomal protein S1
MAKKTTTQTDPTSIPEVKDVAQTPASTPMTMEDLLASSDYVLKVPRTGDVVQGKIVGITKKMVLVDIGGKTEGMVVDKEFDLAQDFIADLAVGQMIDVYVLDGESNGGQILLSLKKAAMDKKWDELARLTEKNETIMVHAFDVNRGGMVVTYEGLRGFIPTSQFGRHVANKLMSLKGTELAVKCLEVNKEQNRLIFSERQVSEAAEIANTTTALDKIKSGDVVKGVITGVKPFGIFVAIEVPCGEKEVGVLEGLVHISEISWDKIDDISSKFSKGQAVEAKVVAVDKEQAKLTLSIKQLQADPWTKLAEEFPVGSTITGHVSRLAPFGVFISIVPGVDGLMHESKVGGAIYEPGQEVQVVIDSIDPQQRRVSLSPTATEVPVDYK